MLRVLSITALLYLASDIANACSQIAKTNLHDILAADVILIGSVIDYKIDGIPNGNRLSQAKFQIKPNKILSGNFTTPITVTWVNSKFGEPKEVNGSREYLFALRKPSSGWLAVNGRYFLPSDSESFTILQAPCAAAFIIPAEGKLGQAIQSIFDDNGDIELKLESIAKSIE